MSSVPMQIRSFFLHGKGEGFFLPHPCFPAGRELMACLGAAAGFSLAFGVDESTERVPSLRLSGFLSDWPPILQPLAIV